LGEGEFVQGEEGAYIEEAKAINQIVRDAVAENSLNPQNIEAAIRKSLLPRLFSLMGLERAKNVIEQVIQVTRIGLSRGTF
jgi:type I restriction enzyme R subunit